MVLGNCIGNVFHDLQIHYYVARHRKLYIHSLHFEPHFLLRPNGYMGAVIKLYSWTLRLTLVVQITQADGNLCFSHITQPK